MSFLADSKWVHTQKKAFKNWANFHLKKRGLEIQNLDTDLKDGILLINLVELLTGREVGRYIKNPKLKVQKINNINLALDTIRKSRTGVVVSASAEDIVEGKTNMVLGIVWTMVHEFQLSQQGGAQKAGVSAKDALLDWVVNELNRSPYKEKIDVAAIKTNFPESFKDGKVFNYLLHRRKPELVDLDQVDKKSAQQNLAFALENAEKHLGVPQLIDPDDILQPNPDEQSMLTYISYFRSTAGSEPESTPRQAAVPDVVPGVVRAVVAQTAEHDTKLKSLEEKLSSLEKSKNDEHQRYQLELEELKADKRKTMTLLDELKSKESAADRLSIQIEELLNKIKEKDLEIEKLKKEKAAEEQRAKEAKEAADRMTAELQRLQFEVDDTKARAIPADDTDWKSLYLEEKAKREKLQADYDKLMKELEELRRKSGDQARSMSDMEDLRRQLEATRSVEDELKRVKKKEAEEKVILEKKIAELELSLETERANADTKRVSKKNPQDVSALKKVKPDVNVKLVEETPSNENLVEVKKKQTEKIDKLTKEVVKLELEIEERDKKLKNRDAELKALQGQSEQNRKSVAFGNPEYLRIEDIIRKLHFKKGAAKHFPELETEYRENKRFVESVGDLRNSVNAVIDDMIYNYRDANADGDPIARKPKDVIEDIEKLISFRQELKSLKNDFVKECNKLGRLYSSKSKNEKSMESHRESLQDTADNHPEQVVKDNDKLWDEVDSAKSLVDNDEDTLEDIAASKSERLAAKHQVQNAVEDLQKHIRSKIDLREEKRMRDLLRELKKTNKKLEHAPFKTGDGDVRVTRDEMIRIANVLRVMVRNYKPLFKDYIGSKQIDQVHPLVKEPIRFLESENHLHKKDLLAKSNQPREKIDVLKEYFYEGHDVELKGQSDPYAVAELLKEYFRDLPQPLLTYKRYEEFDRINDLPDDKVLEELRDSIDELPKVRRATLTLLVGFLTKVARYADENNMTDGKLAEIFGPLILRPFKAAD